MRYDAIVIGSGPAGATAAQLLAQRGSSVALIERAQFPRRKVCGEFISAATLPVLEACGVASDFIALAGPAVHTIAGYAGSLMVEAPVARGTTDAGWGRALGREHLDVLLRDAAVAAGARLFQPAEVVAMRRENGLYRVMLERRGRRQDVTAQILIAACGSWHSKGPFAINDKCRRSDLFAFKARFGGGSLPEGVMPLLAFPGGYGGMVHTNGERVTLSCCIRRDALTAVRAAHGGRAGDAVLRHILLTTDGARRALQNATIEDTFLSAGPIRPGLRSVHRNGIFFIGNIAGEAHPIIAEGISMAIQSAWLLSRSLIESGGADYSRAWKKLFISRLRAASLFACLATNNYSRPIAAQFVRAFPAILSWAAALTGKVPPISKQCAFLEGVKANVAIHDDGA